MGLDASAGCEGDGVTVNEDIKATNKMLETTKSYDLSIPLLG